MGFPYLLFSLINFCGLKSRQADQINDFAVRSYCNVALDSAAIYFATLRTGSIVRDKLVGFGNVAVFFNQSEF